MGNQFATPLDEPDDRHSDTLSNEGVLGGESFLMTESNSPDGASSEEDLVEPQESEHEPAPQDTKPGSLLLPTDNPGSLSSEDSASNDTKQEPQATQALDLVGPARAVLEDSWTVQACDVGASLTLYIRITNVTPYLFVDKCLRCRGNKYWLMRLETLPKLGAFQSFIISFHLEPRPYLESLLEYEPVCEFEIEDGLGHVESSQILFVRLDHFIRHLRSIPQTILVYGDKGVGKSSLINSALSILTDLDSPSRFVGVGNDPRSWGEFSAVSRPEMNHVQFLDTWGLGPPRELYNGSGAIYTEAIHRLQLSGRMVLGTKEINVAKGVPSQAKIGNNGHKPTAVLWLMSSNSVWKRDVHSLLRSILTEQGILPVPVFTRQALYDAQFVAAKATEFEFDLADVVTVDNYTTETARNWQYDLRLLNAIHRASLYNRIK